MKSAKNWLIGEIFAPKNYFYKNISVSSKNRHCSLSHSSVHKVRTTLYPQVPLTSELLHLNFKSSNLEYPIPITLKLFHND